MDNDALQREIASALRSDRRLWSDDGSQLNHSRLFALIEQSDETVVTALWQHQPVRERFFVQIGEGQAYVLRANDLRFFIEEHRVAHSYTAYRNRIGLTAGTRFLRDSGDVVLDFPYKDCVLQGGMSREEGSDTYVASGRQGGYQAKQDKRQEIFFNSVLSPDEIDRLFDAKAYVNWKRFTADGERAVTDIARNESGTITENMIIKGNNLLALHSLRQQFAGKIKLIYIDPPYNTGNDGFQYNDHFNHSTWLTFMKNRLEVARSLLRDDGVMFVQCDDNEQAYLKVLMDEVFGRSHFVANLSVEMSLTQGMKVSAAQQGKIVKNGEYILVYSRQENWKAVNILYDGVSNYDDHFSIFLSEDQGNLQMVPIGEWLETNHDMEKHFEKSGLQKDFQSFKQLITISSEFRKEIYSKYGSCLYRSMMANINVPAHVRSKLANGKVVKFEKYILHQVASGKIRQLLPLSETLGETDDYASTYGRRRIRGNFWKGFYSDMMNIAKEDSTEFKNGKKPSRLIEQIIKLATRTGDIVRDYHLGSGTTAAVAHKMGRQYIGIEQMDYVESIACARLQKVIAGEAGGISKSVGWSGGGEFVYCELAKWNQAAREQIQACQNVDALVAFFDQLAERYFLDYHVRTKEFREQIVHEAAFRNLSLTEQKRLCIAMLDNNQLYVQKSEMADQKYDISASDQQLTSAFYAYKE